MTKYIMAILLLTSVSAAFANVILGIANTTCVNIQGNTVSGDQCVSHQTISQSQSDGLDNL